MASPDPKVAPSTAKEAPEGEGAPELLDASDIDGLAAAGDIDSLLELGQALRAGRGVPRDLPACFRAYDAAARLGSPEGAYASALFLLRGGLVPQDEKEAVARLRTAADAGSLPAKVYLANMYESGVYFRADAEKADVWHRSIARSLGITAAVGSPAYVRSMAEQGVGRYALLLERDVPPAEAATLKKRSTAFGWRAPERAPAAATLSPARARDTEPGLGPPAPEAQRAQDDAPSADDPVKPARAKATARASRPGDAPDPSRSSTAPAARRGRATELGFDWAGGILRWVFLDLFAAAGLAAAHLARQGATLLASRGQAVPLVGPHLEWILPGVLGALVLLPAVALYKLSAVMRALVLAALTGVAGALAWGHGRGTLVADSTTQAIVFALAGFLVGALVFGFTRKRPPVPRVLRGQADEDDDAEND